MLWLKLVQVIIFQMHFAKEAVAQISPNDENVNLGMLQFSEIFDFVVVFYFNFKRKCGRQSYSIPNFTSPSINSVNDFPLDSNIMLCRNNSELSKILSREPPFGPCMPFLDPLFLFWGPLFLFWAHYSFLGPLFLFWALYAFLFFTFECAVGEPLSRSRQKVPPRIEYTRGNQG